MSTTVEAKRVLRKELSKCIRLTEFEYTWEFNDHSITRDSYKLVTKDYEFEIIWTISVSCGRFDPFSNQKRVYTLNKIKSDKCNENIFGNIVFKATSANYNDMNKFSFEANFFPFEKNMNLHCSDGSITTTIQVYREDERSSRSTLETYDNFLETHKSSDVTFIIDNEEIPANKGIVSLHSDVFAKMFESDMIEKSTSKVKIIDIEPKIFKLLLSFMYSRQLDCQDTEELLKLIIAADKYEVKSLVNLCGYRISNKLIVDNVIEALIIADRVRDNYFKKDCMDFIINNKEKVTSTENFKSILVESRADLLAEIFCQLKLNN